MTQAPSPLAQLPGDPMIWVLIVSELLVFSAGLAAFLAVRIGDPAGFADAQSALHQGRAGINTVVLVTSGWLAACALTCSEAGRHRASALRLILATALGVVILRLVAWANRARNVEAGAAFWHMVDPVRIIMFPVIYLLR